MRAVAQHADQDAAGHAGRVEQGDHEGAGRGVEADGAGVGGEVGGREGVAEGLEYVARLQHPEGLEFQKGQRKPLWGG